MGGQGGAVAAGSSWSAKHAGTCCSRQVAAHARQPHRPGLRPACCRSKPEGTDQWRLHMVFDATGNYHFIWMHVMPKPVGVPSGQPQAQAQAWAAAAAAAGRRCSRLSAGPRWMLAVGKRPQQGTSHPKTSARRHPLLGPADAPTHLHCRVHDGAGRPLAGRPEGDRRAGGVAGRDGAGLSGVGAREHLGLAEGIKQWQHVMAFGSKGLYHTMHSNVKQLLAHTPREHLGPGACSKQRGVWLRVRSFSAQEAKQQRCCWPCVS